ncbi:asparaginase [Candidatus Gracilibacteria bacterium]|nr:asparaginase [Candidatus Gracilibacteria bacterium]
MVIKDYKSSPWVKNNGNPWSGKSWGKGKFNPDAFDPSIPYEPKGKTYSFSLNPDKKIENPFDLDNLRFFNKKKVERLLELLEDFATDIEKKKDGRQIVSMIGTGGTIAMTDQNGELVPKLDPEYLLKYAGGTLNERFAITAIEFPTLIDSSQMEIDYEADSVIIMSWIWENMSENLKKLFSGFLITHGTDTMPEGGAYTAIMLGPQTPFSVGFVGAQKTTEDNFSDVGINVKNSLDTLSVLKKEKTSVCFIYMGGSEGGAYNPTGVIKISDSNVIAMESPMHPKIVDASNFVLSSLTNSFQKRVKKENNQKFHPIIIRGYAPTISVNPKLGTNPNHVYETIKKIPNTVAVIITTFGSFTLNNKITKAAQQATKETRKLFCVANPFPEGKVDHKYGPAHILRNSGAVSVSTMPIAAQAKATLAQHIYGNDLEKIAAFMAGNNLVGEQPPNWKQPIKFKDIIEPYGLPKDLELY